MHLVENRLFTTLPLENLLSVFYYYMVVINGMTLNVQSTGFLKYSIPGFY